MPASVSATDHGGAEDPSSDYNGVDFGGRRGRRRGGGDCATAGLLLCRL